MKELLENAIDAKSTEINIEVEQSGISSIRVVDNSTGIEQDDLDLVFHRHATSKLDADDDLFHIKERWDFVVRHYKVYLQLLKSHLKLALIVKWT